MRSMLLILFNVLALAALAVTFMRMRQARRQQDQLLPELRGTPHWTRIYISRPTHFARMFKLLAYEARGVLIDEGETVRVLGETSPGERIDHRYQKDSLSLRWLGNRRIADGNLHWIEIGNGTNALTISADTGMNAVASREASADILRRIAPHLELPQSARAEFAIDKNRRSLFVVIGFFVLGGFALLDGVVLNDNTLLNGKAVMTIAPFFGLLGIASYPMLTRGGVPSRESWALSMLLGMALAFAFVPLVKRVDQWAAADSTLTVVYKLQARGRFVSVNNTAPAIDYGRYREYWDQFEPGSLHEFQLIHGPLGLWQLEQAQLRERLRAFYEKNK